MWDFIFIKGFYLSSEKHFDFFFFFFPQGRLWTSQVYKKSKGKVLKTNAWLLWGGYKVPCSWFRGCQRMIPSWSHHTGSHPSLRKRQTRVEWHTLKPSYAGYTNIPYYCRPFSVLFSTNMSPFHVEILKNVLFSSHCKSHFLIPSTKCYRIILEASNRRLRIPVPCIICKQCPNWELSNALRVLPTGRSVEWLMCNSSTTATVLGRGWPFLETWGSKAR